MTGERPPVAVVTDSTACIPPELVERHGIEVVPLHIIFGGRTFVDSLAAGTREFYDVLRRSADKPTTAAPSPGMFVDAILRAASGGRPVLVITVSRQFSAMYDSARQAIDIARERAPGSDIRLFDSRSAAMAQGFVAIEAARAAEAGADIGAVVERAGAMAARVTLIAVIDTLTYLARSGRVPRVAAWAAGMLQVKPIVRFSASDIKLAGRARTRARALDRLVDLVAATAARSRAHVAVHHAAAPDDAAYVLARLRERLDIAEAYVTEFTQVMAVHTGPGLTGVAFWTE